jgi:PAS domain S-box-containing protein
MNALWETMSGWSGAATAPPLPGWPRLRFVAQLLLFAAVYGITAKVGLNYSSVAPNVTLIWPPTGISLFVVLRFGYRYWPGIVLGDLIANYGTGAPLLSMLGIACGNILQTLVCAWLLQRYAGFRIGLERVRDALALVLLSSACASISAFVGPASLALGGAFPWSLYGTVWLQWLMGDATGVIVLAPLLLAWSGRPALPSTRTRRIEATLLALVLVAVSEAVFGGFGLALEGYYPAALAIFPVMVWAALRFGLRGATATTLVVSVAAIWGTVQGSGPFVLASGVDSLVHWWVFVNVITVTGLLLATSRHEHRRAREELQQERDFVATILDTEDALVAVLDRDGKVARTNRAFQQLTGYRPGQAIGRSFLDLAIAPEQRDKVRASGEILRLRLSNLARYEADLIKRNGERLQVSWSNAVLRDARGNIEHVIVTGIDITARNEAAQALRRARRELAARVEARTRELAHTNASLRDEMAQRRRLEHEIIHVAEHEQMRIGQELHDGLGQHLTATAFLAAVLAAEARDADQVRRAVEIERMLSEAVSQTRLLARGLFPVELEANGLMAALQQLAADTGRLFGVSCRFVCHAPVLLSDNAVAVNLHRIAQEAINNAVKHSGAASIRVELGRDGAAAVLTVSDDGSGLREEARRGAGMGLRIMRYRAALIGGALELDNHAAGGLRVSVRVPLVEENADEHACIPS